MKGINELRIIKKKKNYLVEGKVLKLLGKVKEKEIIVNTKQCSV